MTEITLRPGRRPGRYDAMLDGDLVVADSRDPEHDAARELVRRGFTGAMVTRWAGSAHLSTRPRDIATVARWTISESSSGLRRTRWAPFSRWGDESRSDATAPTRAG